MYVGITQEVWEWASGGRIRQSLVHQHAHPSPSSLHQLRDAQLQARHQTVVAEEIAMRRDAGPAWKCLSHRSIPSNVRAEWQITGNTSARLYRFTSLSSTTTPTEYFWQFSQVSAQQRVSPSETKASTSIVCSVQSTTHISWFGSQ